MAICGVVCIGMAMGISYGISSAIGLYFAPLHNILPFLLLGKTNKKKIGSYTKELIFDLYGHILPERTNIRIESIRSSKIVPEMNNWKIIEL